MSKIALSDLNRAADGGRESYWWIHALAGAYCVLIGGFSVAAWIDAGHGFKAAMCAGAQVLAIACAILGRRAFTGQMGFSGFIALGGAAGCAWWAALGVQHAWQVNGEPISWEMVLFLAALEPGLFLLAEHVQEGREALRRAAAREAREEEERLRAARDRQARLDAEADAARRAREAAPRANVTPIAAAKRPSVARRVACGAVKVGAGVGVAMSGAAAADTPNHTPSPILEPVARHASAHAGADARVAEACALRHKGLSQAEVAAHMGVSIRTVSRLWARARAETAAA